MPHARERHIRSLLKMKQWEASTSIRKLRKQPHTHGLSICCCPPIHIQQISCRAPLYSGFCQSWPRYTSILKETSKPKQTTQYARPITIGIYFLDPHHILFQSTRTKDGFHAAASTTWLAASFCPKASRYSCLQIKGHLWDSRIRRFNWPPGIKVEIKIYKQDGEQKKPYLAGRLSWGRLKGVQTGSPTNSLIAWKINFIKKQVFLFNHTVYNELA